MMNNIMCCNGLVSRTSEIKMVTNRKENNMKRFKIYEVNNLVGLCADCRKSVIKEDKIILELNPDMMSSFNNVLSIYDMLRELIIKRGKSVYLYEDGLNFRFILDNSEGMVYNGNRYDHYISRCLNKDYLMRNVSDFSLDISKSKDKPKSNINKAMLMDIKDLLCTRFDLDYTVGKSEANCYSCDFFSNQYDVNKIHHYEYKEYSNTNRSNIVLELHGKNHVIDRKKIVTMRVVDIEPYGKKYNVKEKKTYINPNVFNDDKHQRYINGKIHRELFLTKEYSYERTPYKHVRKEIVKYEDIYVTDFLNQNKISYTLNGVFIDNSEHYESEENSLENSIFKAARRFFNIDTNNTKILNMYLKMLHHPYYLIDGCMMNEYHDEDSFFEDCDILGINIVDIGRLYQYLLERNCFTETVKLYEDSCDDYDVLIDERLGNLDEIEEDEDDLTDNIIEINEGSDDESDSSELEGEN